MSQQATEIFAFLRGAVRGSYGIEDFRGLGVLFIEMGSVEKELLKRLNIDGVDLYFLDNCLINYNDAHMICPGALPYQNQRKVQILIDLANTKGPSVTVGPKTVVLPEFGEDPYTQGFHEFYL